MPRVALTLLALLVLLVGLPVILAGGPGAWHGSDVHSPAPHRAPSTPPAVNAVPAPAALSVAATLGLLASGLPGSVRPPGGVLLADGPDHRPRR